ncbi:MAG: malate--CoA ligase subunit beta [Chromatiales bacterium]|nr:malate--CoA ligase subunit beta [Chromatiales bacterium]
MNLHEYQAKEILHKSGIKIANAKLAYSPDQAVSCYREIGTPTCAVKAQVHSGARGKAGGIKICSSEEEIRKYSNSILGTSLVTHQTGSQGKIVEKIYIEEGTDIGRELYLAFVLDRATERIVAIASAVGGMDIEELAESQPQAIIRLPIDPAVGMQPFQARELAFALDIPKTLLKDAVYLIIKCYQTFEQSDANLLEINPLVITKSEDKLVPLDAKLAIDDNALFKHPEIAQMRDKSQEDHRETNASEHDLSYVGLDGNIGCMINGAGLAMATMDMIKHAGGEPANFLDIGGGASPERVAKAFELVLEDKNVKSMLVNIYAGINRCDWIAEGLIKAIQSIELRVPLIARLSGTNVEQGQKMLKESGLPITSTHTLGEAAEKAVAAAQT